MRFAPGTSQHAVMIWDPRSSSSGSMLTLIMLLLLSVLPYAAIAITISGLPSGFISEVVANTAAITGLFAPNPRNNGKPMLILVSKTGSVNVLEDPDNSDKSIRILNLGGDELCSNGERGIQSLALHPMFTQNYIVYLFYNKFRQGCEQQTGNEPWNVVVRLPMDPLTLQLNWNATEEIWRASKSHKAVHNGGAMIFGNDGYLYVTTGDGGNSENSQPLTNTHGSVIRLNDDGSIPDSNPFTTQNGYNSVRCADTNGEAPEGSVCSEVYAHGLRNPFRIAIDPRETNKTLFTISDVGGSYWEEINYAGTDYAGKNYGYPVLEGVCSHGSAIKCPQPGENTFEDPFHWYQHRSVENGGCVSGATFVPAGVFPPKYKYLFADFVFNEVYKLSDDGDECRSCSPPTSGFRNETFFQSLRGPEDESDDTVRMTDMFFGPYQDSQALYVIFRGNTQTVLRFRWNAIKDNGIPIPLITVDDRPFQVGESIQFNGSSSQDPDGDALDYLWYFGDGSTSTQENPSHSYTEMGEYLVRLLVTDPFEQEQETTHIIVVGSPPTATIAFPEEGQQFVVGQVFTLNGSGLDANGKRLDDAQLSWEVRQHHADHWHPFLDPTSGNNIVLSPAPAPEDFFASTNSYLKVILTATDANGLTTEVERIIQPTKALINIETIPQGLTMMVDYYPVETSDQIVSWIDHDLIVSVDDQPPYIFTSWSDGVLDRDRNVKVTEDGQVVQANFCLVDGSSCDGNDECCSGQCTNAVCVEPGPTSPLNTATSPPTVPPSSSPTGTASESPTMNPTAEPPLITILSPLEGQKFAVGQTMPLVGFAVDRVGFVLPQDQLFWSMHVVSTSDGFDLDTARQPGSNSDVNVIWTVMNRTQGNGLDTPRCPNPVSLSSVETTHIQIWLEASDPTDGATATFIRTFYPELESLELNTNPQGLQIIVNGTVIPSGTSVRTWKYGDLSLTAIDHDNYRFVRWEDDDFSDDTNSNNADGPDRIVRLPATGNNASNSVSATFCGIWDASCADDSDCCSDFLCGSTAVCQSRDGTPRPTVELNTPEDGITLAASTDNGKSSNSTGLGAGVASMIVVLLIIIVVGILIVVRRRRSNQTDKIIQNATEFSDEVDAVGALVVSKLDINDVEKDDDKSASSLLFDDENQCSADNTFELDTSIDHASTSSSKQDNGKDGDSPNEGDTVKP